MKCLESSVRLLRLLSGLGVNFPEHCNLVRVLAQRQGTAIVAQRYLSLTSPLHPTTGRSKVDKAETSLEPSNYIKSYDFAPTLRRHGVRASITEIFSL
jgi:hypothetical protein